MPHTRNGKNLYVCVAESLDEALYGHLVMAKTIASSAKSSVSRNGLSYQSRFGGLELLDCQILRESGVKPETKCKVGFAR